MSPINKKLFQSSVRHVRKELKTLGFGKKKVIETTISRTFLPSFSRRGYFTHDGQIFIPVLQPKGGLRDIIRHEYGHAVLYNYPGVKAKKNFVCFGHTSDKRDYVSEYAMTNPNEDFCETFMMYMRHRGKMPRRYSSPRLKKKWDFIAALQRRFGSS